MPEDRSLDLAAYRIVKAEECYKAAVQLFESGLLPDSANRSYYAIFHAVRAILALDHKDFSKHSGVISYFQMQYVKKSIFDVKYSDYLRDAFSIRQQCDYDDFFVIANEDVGIQIQHAREFIDAVKGFLSDYELKNSGWEMKNPCETIGEKV